MPARCKSAQLPVGLHAVGTVNYSYPYGPVNYTAAPKKAPYGVGYWRPEHTCIVQVLAHPEPDMEPAI